MPTTTIATTPQTALAQLHWRYATKQFDPTKQIAPDTWQVLEQSLVLSPSSFGLQPWKFFVIRNPDIRQQLLPHSWGQKQIVEASHFVVFAIKKDLDITDVDRFMARTAEVQQTPIEALDGYRNVIKSFLDRMSPAEIDTWATRQAYIALGEFMTVAAMLEVDTCPIEGFIPPKYDEVLGLTAQGYASVVVCVAGYRSIDDKSAARPKVRFATNEMVQYID